MQEHFPSIYKIMNSPSSVQLRKKKSSEICPAKNIKYKETENRKTKRLYKS